MPSGNAAVAREEVELSFKRYILEKTEEFEREPMADLYRVNLLGQMLDRYDALRDKGMNAEAALQQTQEDFADIPRRMRREGFEELNAPTSSGRWEQLTEDEAAVYVKQSSDYQHRVAMGAALCSACVAPLMAFTGLTAMISYTMESVGGTIGLVGMFAMIGLGVYSLTTAKKPKNRAKIRSHEFSISPRLRKKLLMLKEAADEKTRRRRGKGIALLATCVVPIFIGAALDGVLNLNSSDPFAILGVAAMFLMIGLGVYEVTAAPGEKKPLNELLKDD